MAFFLFSLISLLGFIHLSLQNEDRLQFVSTETDWESAQNKCTDAQRILMSEKPIASSLAEVEPGEVTWTNAKVTWIEYASGLVEYLKLAYMQSDTFLENCICVNNNGMKACARTKTSVNWTDAHKKCTFDGDAWDPLQASKLKSSVAMLDKGPSVWLSKFTLNDLDDSVSMCVCLKRLEDGSFVERLDNCSNSHSYVCAMDPARYAPTLTRLEVKIPELAKDDGDSGDSTNSVHQESNGRTTVIGFIAGGIAGCIVLVIAAIGGVHACRRYHRRRQYRQSLRRYSNKQTIRSKGTVPRVMDQEKGLSRTLDNSCLQGNIRYEDCTGKKYATLQGEVARECKGRLNQQSYVNDRGPNVDSLEDLEGYEEFSPSYKKFCSLEPDQEVYENTGVNKTSKHAEEEDCYLPSGKPALTKKTGIRQQSSQQQQNSVGDENTEYGKAKYNYDVPPRRERGRFGQKVSTAAGNKKKAIAAEMLQQAKRAREETQAPALDDLDNYENFDTLKRNCKALKDLNELESYENFAQRNKRK